MGEEVGEGVGEVVGEEVVDGEEVGASVVEPVPPVVVGLSFVSFNDPSHLHTTEELVGSPQPLCKLALY